ncbi:hypothetical protein ARMSODRAFT_893753 [Armillaria solidipes]|uniref:Uncharacterized protein n=1 Tax=Armillaria solidipes TaxID=1076256 RepID=A0A2H3BH49_9AGAR|nr:hypothetical protein ARMSODRAFT_893753 [Armillaria solidipes]
MVAKGNILQWFFLWTATAVTTYAQIINGSLVVNSTTGVHLAYLDTGAPSHTSSYTTIFAVHGMVFTNLIFQKVMSVASSNGVRFVAIQRRPFPGSTPFTDEELNVTLTGGSGDEERDFEIEMRGHEISSFVDIFIQNHNLPRVSNDGKSGGASLLGWSVGGAYVVAAIASTGTLPVDVQTRLGAYVRSMIVYEAAPIVLGLPTPSQNWAPLVDTTMPEDLRLPAFGQWCTGYFDHGNITLSSAHDLDSLSWILTTPEHVPTFYKIPVEELDRITRYGSDAATDLPFLFFFANQLNAVYRKAFNDEGIGAIFPLLTRSFLCGDETGAFGVSGLWAIQDDQIENGTGTTVDYKLVPGGNHFMMWDNPETAFSAFMDLA